MKKKLIVTFVFLALAIMMLAFSVNAECVEHTYSWSLTVSSKGLLDNVSAVGECSSCGSLTNETIQAPFIALGYSSSDDGVTQSYAINRAALERYEELSKTTVRFGAVIATRNAIGEQNPINENGEAVSEKVMTYDCTDLNCDIVDVVVKGIPSEYKDSVDIIFALYINTNNKISYLDNCIQKDYCGARSLGAVENGPEAEMPLLTEKMVMNGKSYTRMSLDKLKLQQYSYYNTSADSNLNVTSESHGTGKLYYATDKFSKDDIPLGSIIVVESGWKYRPEGFPLRGSRPDNVSTRTVIVDTFWWASYEERGFNISNGKSVKGVTKEAIYDIFAIYVPDEKIELTQVSYEDLGLIKSAYYHSNDSGDRHYLLHTLEKYSDARKYFTTKKFTKDDLPVGTVIEIAEGWQYRPDGWVDGGYNKNRPNTTSIKTIVITEQWWGSYTERAFNIGRTDGEYLDDYSIEDIAEIFKIYLPPSSY